MPTKTTTVPVDLVNQAAGILDCEGYGDESRQLLECLPEVPAPEGGAVMRAEDAPVWADGIVTDGERVSMAQKAEADHGGTYWAVDGGDGGLDWEPTHFVSLSALATREEAPAEAGERECGWCDGRKTKQTPSTDFTIPCPYCKGTGKEALRAQPPAREDAQPVAVKALVDAALTYTSSRGYAPGFGPLGKLHEAALAVKRSPYYTHPAPDALRLALSRAVHSYDGIPPHHRPAWLPEALAALQAEQKGGA